MKIHLRLADRLRPYATLQAYPGVARWMARLLSPPAPRDQGWMARLLWPPTLQEHERRRAHLAALLLVAVVTIAKNVSGLTDGSATYMLYVLAIAVSALGGFVPGCVAALAAVLLLSAP